MDLFVQGKGKVRLSQADFVAQGGEGSVYAQGDVAFKIYADPAKMIPAAKIRELAALTEARIIRPQEVLLDRKNQPVGYSMRRAKDALPLCQLFTRAFRERRGVSPDAVLALVRRLQEGVEHVHAQGILVVDLNEMNFLLDAALQEVFFIDVDSYQTPSFPATALMESVRDRHASGFSRETDWFSFGIVSFQMFVGIHPYKGKHPALADMDARMRANISVLNADVSIPKVCYPFSVVPQVYLDWYRAVFEEGKRLPPPVSLQATATVTPPAPTLSSGSRVRLKELRRFPAEILYPVPASGGYAAVTAEGLFMANRRVALGRDARFGVTPRTQHLIAAWLHGRRLELFDVTAGVPVQAGLEAEALTSYDGRLYLKRGAALFEVEFLELPSGVRAALKPVGNAMEHSTQLFDGVAMQSMLGAVHASVFPRAGACYSRRLVELDDYRVVDARFEKGVLMAVGVKDGRYDRFVFRFDERYCGHDTRVASDVAYAGLNFVVLDNGVCVHLNEAEELELFSSRIGSTGTRTVQDDAIRGARLHKDGTQVLLSRGETLYGATLT